MRRATAAAVILAAGLVVPAATADAASKQTPKATIRSLRAEVASLEKKLAADNAEIANLRRTPATTVPATTTTTVPAVIFQQAGSGIANTAAFRVPKAWELHWTYDCSAFGSTGNFQIDIDAPGDTTDASPLTQNNGPNQLGADGSGIEHYYIGNATAILQIDSECAWTVEVTP